MNLSLFMRTWGLDPSWGTGVQRGWGWLKLGHGLRVGAFTPLRALPWGSLCRAPEVPALSPAPSMGWGGGHEDTWRGW